MRPGGRGFRPATILAALVVLGSACTDAFGPRVGSQYALRTINDRALPTPFAAGTPTATLYEVYSAAQFRVISDSIIAYDLRIDLVARHADGTINAVPANCWDNYPFRYTRQGDSLILSPARQLQVPPPPAPVLRLRDGELLGELDAPGGRLRMRFQLDDHPSQPCEGFMQVASSR